jgi:hypothetical protein
LRAVSAGARAEHHLGRPPVFAAEPAGGGASLPITGYRNLATHANAAPET